MSHRTIKDVLIRWRPGAADDPEISDALDHARSDPELGRWFERHKEFQSAIQQRLRGMEPPPGLKEQILSERKAVFGFRLSRRTAVSVGVVAALGVLALLWIEGRPGSERRFETFRSRMVRTALRGYAMDVATNDPDRIREYLSERGAQGDWLAPPGLLDTPLLGCAALVWQSQPAAMICYGEGPTPDLWLFVVDSKSLPNPPAAAEPQFERVNRLGTLSWTDAGRTYVLAGKADERDLRQLFNRTG